MGQKNALFEKQSGEVVENTYLLKKQTGNEPKRGTPYLLKLIGSEKRAEKRTGESSAPYYLRPVAASPLRGPWLGWFDAPNNGSARLRTAV